MDNETILYAIAGTITGGALFRWLKSDYDFSKDINSMSDFVINKPIKAYGIRQAYYKRCEEIKVFGPFSYFAKKNLSSSLEKLKDVNPNDLENLVDKMTK
ncbi:hypothetical protein KY334_04735 [Candidatus Woesearchaeota archaeon]|nr:hypothetical protein [Candidatus Woesearchaeota archaeon]